MYQSSSKNREIDLQYYYSLNHENLSEGAHIYQIIVCDRAFNDFSRPAEIQVISQAGVSPQSANVAAGMNHGVVAN